MTDKLEHKISHSLPPWFSKLQLTQIHCDTPFKQSFTAFNPETEENVLLNIYVRSNNSVNYQETVQYNEFLIALAVKQKAHQYSFQIDRFKLIERNDPVHEYSSKLYCVITYKMRNTVPLTEILKAKTD